MKIDIDNLQSQNTNDLSAIKELYRKIEEMEKEISQIKYINEVLADKLKKELEKKQLIFRVTLNNEVKTLIDKFMHGFLNRVYGYDDYTQLEINSKLIQKIEEVIENCNNAFEFVEWLKEQGVPDEVQNILFTWKEDGTVKNLLGNLIEELKEKVEETNEKLTNDNETIKTQLETIKNNVINKISTRTHADYWKT